MVSSGVKGMEHGSLKPFGAVKGVKHQWVNELEGSESSYTKPFNLIIFVGVR